MWDRDKNNEIYIKKFNVAQARQLKDQPELDYAPAWSPDGKQIAYTVSSDGNKISGLFIDGYAFSCYTIGKILPKIISH